MNSSPESRLRTRDEAMLRPARSRAREIARQAYVYGIWLLFASIIFQFFLAGLGVLDNPVFFSWHATLGVVVGLLPLVLVAVGAFGQVPRGTLWLTAAVFALVVLQSVLIDVYRYAMGSVRAIAALHLVNALLIFWVCLKLLERAARLSTR